MKKIENETNIQELFKLINNGDTKSDKVIKLITDIKTYSDTQTEKEKEFNEKIKFRELFSLVRIIRKVAENEAFAEKDFEKRFKSKSYAVWSKLDKLFKEMKGANKYIKSYKAGFNVPDDHRYDFLLTVIEEMNETNLKKDRINYEYHEIEPIAELIHSFLSQI